jgi:diketogulonate reductase-like aldo/keto reductase
MGKKGMAAAQRGTAARASGRDADPGMAVPGPSGDMQDTVTSAAGVRSPRILYGTAWKKADTERLVRLALDCGFRGIDTACQPRHYDEAGVGAAVAASLSAALPRESLYLQTKFTPPGGHDPGTTPYDAGAPLAAQIAQSFEVSLANLRTGYVDALLLHSPLPTARETLQAWRALESIAESGRARQIGLSNCYDPRQLETLYSAARVKPAVLQNRFHAGTGYDLQIRRFCADHGILYQSFWTLTANPHLLAHPAITGPAHQHARTPAQVLFRYLAQSGVVPLTGTTSETHMREDLAITEFELSPRERAAIDAVVAGAWAAPAG